MSIDQRLEIKDLRLVLALHAAGTTARAAGTLHLTQPAVSRALLSVEDRLGVRLFERTPRRLLPTPACTTLLAGASRVLAELAALESAVRTPRALPRIVRLVCECYSAYQWLPSTLCRLKKTLPDLEVVLAVEHTREPATALQTGRVDVALLTFGETPRPTCEDEPLFSDAVVFAMSRTHPLAGRKALTPRDLEAYPLLTSRLPKGEGQWFLRSAFGKARPKLNFEFIPLTEAVVDITRAGTGIAILSEWLAAPHLQDGALVVKHLARGPLRRPWRLAWQRDFAPLAKVIGQVLREEVPSDGGKRAAPGKRPARLVSSLRRE